MGFSTLKDALGAKKVPCRVRGCTNTWLWRSDEQARAWAKGDLSPPSRLCESCYERSGELDDRKVPCSKPGCENTWLWTKAAQLAARARDESREGPPRGLCDPCRAEVKQLADRVVSCRVRGCARSWSWTGRAQHLAGVKDASATPPATMCDACHALYPTLADVTRPCRVEGCGGTWLWTRWHQLEAAAGGKKEPAARMCDGCAALFDALVDREVPCRTPGCKRTWTWKRGTQLDALVLARKSSPGELPDPNALEPPSRMCADCSRSYGELADQELPCKVPGCKKSWVWKRGAQLKEQRKVERKARNSTVRPSSEPPWPSRRGQVQGDKERAPERTFVREERSDAGDAADGPLSTDQGKAGKSEGGVSPEAIATTVESAAEEEPTESASATRGREAPQRMCSDCQRELDELADQEIACSNAPDGCSRTFTWTRMAQLIGRRRGHAGSPPKHLCAPCAEFLKGRITKTILCQRCAGELHWPPRSQLMTFLGKWIEPSLCGGCRAAGAAEPSPAPTPAIAAPSDPTTPPVSSE